MNSKLKHIIHVLSGLLLGVYLSLLLLFNFSPLQESLTLYVQDALAEKLSTEVKIGKVEIGFLNRVILHDVLVKDQNGEKLLSAGLLSCKIEFLPFMKGEVSLRTISLLDAKVALYKTSPHQPLNFDFIIQAFSSKDSSTSSDLNLRANSIILRRCSVAYDVRYEPALKEKLDPNHLFFSDIDANVSLKKVTPDSLNFRIRSLKIKEKSGLDVRSLTLRLSANRQLCKIENFRLKLSHTNIEQDELLLKYDATTLSSLPKTLQVVGQLSRVDLAVADFAFLDSRLKKLDQQLSLLSSFDIAPGKVNLKGLTLKEKIGMISVDADVYLEMEQGKMTNCYLDVDDLYISHQLVNDIYTHFAHQQKLPVSLSGIGDMYYSGILDYQKMGISQLMSTLKTNAGTLQAKLSLKDQRVTGVVVTDSVNFPQLLGKENLPSNVDLNVDVDLDFQHQGLPSGSLNCWVKNILFKNYSYQDVRIDSKILNNRIHSSLLSKDENADLSVHFTADYFGKRLRNLNVVGNIYCLNLKHLNLTHHFGAADLKGDFETFLQSTDFSSPKGKVLLKNFCLCDAEVDTFKMNHLTVDAYPSSQGTKLSLVSDFGHAFYDGSLDIASLKASLLSILSEYVDQIEKPQLEHAHKNCTFRAHFSNTDFIPALARIPLDMPTGFHLEGGIQTDKNDLLFTFTADSILYNQSVLLRKPSLIVKKKEASIAALFQGVKKMGRSELKFAFDAKAFDNQVKSRLNWNDFGDDIHHGSVHTDFRFEEENQVQVNLHSPGITIDDTLWRVQSGNILLQSNSVEVRDFEFGRENQWVKLHGRFSKENTDTLTAHLKNIDVNYILNLFNVNPVSFLGLATGKAHIHFAKPDSLDIDGLLYIPDFKFNNALLGDANIHINWNSANSRIRFDQTKIVEKNIGYTHVSGYVSPAEKGLDLHVNSHRTNLSFLNKYLSGIFGNIEGRTSGYTRIFGPFKQIDFSGHQQPDLTATILSTNVRYRLNNGSVELQPGSFGFSNFVVSDKENNSGMVHGLVRHSHLKNIQYHFNLTEAENLLFYDCPRKLDMPFFATAYASGNATLSGSPGILNLSADIRPGDKTLFVYTVDDPSTASGDARLLKFVSSEKNDSTSKILRKETYSPGLHLVFHFNIDMNPVSTLRVITNPKSGDFLDLHATGNIEADYDSKGEFTLRHPLTIQGGTYQMNIQNVINKKLTFKPGGQIHFNGNPFKATLNLEAVYTVPSVSLSDLNMGNRLSTSTTPVNCVFLFGGTAGAPQIDFSFELPNASDEVEQMVKDLISTEEDKRMQALYLLGIGRFYTYNYSSTAAAENQSQTSVAMKSFLSSTLSSQLNNILQSAIPSANWTFGANLATGTVGWSDMEVEGILSGRLLSGRLLVNGNFGYREKLATYSNTHFVGDFDVEYLLTPSGNVSLRAYSQTNDRYFSTSSLTTQGIGIRLQKQFDHIFDLFKSKSVNKSLLPSDTIVKTNTDSLVVESP